MTELVVTKIGPIGHITLNRPQAINALTLPMILGIHSALDQWRDDDGILAVVIDGAGPKGFCAGGDIRSIHAARHNPEFGYDIFKAEYTLNYKIHSFPKPYLAFMHGATMGGGVGVSIYGSHRIVCESTKFAMPECAIGLFPDIGANWFFNAMPGQLGRWLALTGHAINAADCLFAGVATDYIPHALWPKLLGDLSKISDPGQIEAILSQYRTQLPEPGILAHKQSWIEDHFSYADLRSIIHHLPHTDHAMISRQYLQKNSPTSMVLCFEAMRRAKGQNLHQVLMTDLLLSQQCLRRPEFYEGVRAAVIDKDRSPRWSPPQIDGVDASVIHGFFDPIPGIDCDVFLQ